MNSLRRDLFERRLWPIVIILLLAIVAVPFLLGRHHSRTDATLADAPAPLATVTQTATTATATTDTAPSTAQSTTKPTAHHPNGGSRDPFGTNGSSSSTTSTTRAGTSTASSTEKATARGIAESVASMAKLSPAPATDTSGSSNASGATLASAAKRAEQSTPTATTATTSTAAPAPITSTTASPTTPTALHPAVVPHHYTVRVVDLHLDTPSGSLTLDGADRLTPLPAASWPKLMYMGTTADGHAAVLALGAAVSAYGPALCRPSHGNCALIELPAGRTERFTYWLPLHGMRTYRLKVNSISSTVTTSRAVADAAYDLHSAAGLCELQLGDPIQYMFNSATGSLDSESGSACTPKMAKIAFPSPAARSGL